MNKRDPITVQQKKNFFKKGVKLFSEKKFYEAHEAWEEIWLREEGELKNLYQALIILAAGFHHLYFFKRNKRSVTALKKAILKLKQF